MNILITGATGYIGSHTIVELLNNNYNIIGIDDFSNSKKEVLENIKKITNKDIIFYEGKVQDKTLLRKIFKENSIDAVIHFAGFKAVGESVNKPLMYYDNNLVSTISLLEIMAEFNCYKFIFSSSATVYGKPQTLPIKEDFPLSTTNPYGATKLMIETILQDLSKSNKLWRVAILRYFNPVGAHESGLIGEDPNGIPNNLVPYIVNVALDKAPYLKVFGNDYDTKDGTGVRDYIHVVDLAIGHVKALEHLKTNDGLDIFNLGTGRGYSVLEIVNAFEKVNNIKIKYEIVERRPGDIASCYADSSYAKEKLNWTTKYDLDKMMQDAYNFLKPKK